MCVSGCVCGLRGVIIVITYEILNEYYLFPYLNSFGIKCESDTKNFGINFECSFFSS